jgi:hypothetical protein
MRPELVEGQLVGIDRRRPELVEGSAHMVRPELVEGRTVGLHAPAAQGWKVL